MRCQLIDIAFTRSVPQELAVPETEGRILERGDLVRVRDGNFVGE